MAALAVGLRVQLSGLNARPDLNGKEAELLHYAEDAGRWAVRVCDGSGESVRIKPANLARVVQAPAARAQQPTKFWEQAARCLQEAQGDFGIARDYYYKAVAQQLQMSDPALHAEMQSGAHAGPGQEARVALTFDTAAAFLQSSKDASGLNPGLANDQRAIAKAACHWPSDGTIPDFRPDSRVLDVGCGDGAYVRMLSECGACKEGYLGLDLSSNMITRARILNEGYTFEQASFMTSPLLHLSSSRCSSSDDRDSSGSSSSSGGASGVRVFDTVLFHATLHYLPDTAAAIERAVGCLHRDPDRAARIVIAQVSGAAFVRREHAKHPLVAVKELPSAGEVKALAAKHGFTLLPRPDGAPPLDEFYLLVLERKAS